MLKKVFTNERPFTGNDMISLFLATIYAHCYIYTPTDLYFVRIIKMSIINDDKELCVKLKPKQKNLSISNRFSIFFLERL